MIVYLISPKNNKNWFLAIDKDPVSEEGFMFEIGMNLSVFYFLCF